MSRTRRLDSLGRPRRVLGRILATAGILAGLGAGVTFLSLDRPAGDVGAIESSLTSLSIAQFTGGGTEPDPSSREDQIGPQAEIVPLWSINETARLDVLPAIHERVPVGLRIDSLDVAAPVGAYGIDRRTGQMDVPSNVTDVGWYEHGPAPGEPGSAVLAAHVDLAGEGPGVFFQLKSLEPGEIVIVTYDDGGQGVFEVQARRTYEKDELPLDAIFSREGKPVLTLITCGGAFSDSSRSYDSNVVVYAAPVEAPAVTLPS